MLSITSPSLPPTKLSTPLLVAFLCSHTVPTIQHYLSHISKYYYCVTFSCPCRWARERNEVARFGRDRFG